MGFGCLREGDDGRWPERIRELCVGTEEEGFVKFPRAEPPRPCQPCQSACLGVTYGLKRNVNCRSDKRCRMMMVCSLM